MGMFIEVMCLVIRDIIWERFLVFSLAGDGSCLCSFYEAKKSSALNLHPPTGYIEQCVSFTTDAKDGCSCILTEFWLEAIY
jgi:hypothetical protein